MQLPSVECVQPVSRALSCVRPRRSLASIDQRDRQSIWLVHTRELQLLFLGQFSFRILAAEYTKYCFKDNVHGCTSALL